MNMMPSNQYEMIAIAVPLVLIVLLVVFALAASKLFEVLRNPFRYPYFTYDFDISGKRNVDIDDLIEQFLLDPANRSSVEQHRQQTEQWKQNCAQFIETHRLKERRRMQLAQVMDDEHAFGSRRRERRRATNK